MRRLVFVGTVLSTFCVHAAAVLWNGVELQKDAYANGDVDYTLRWCSFYPDIPGVVDYYDLQVRMYVTTLNDNNVQRYALSSYNDDSAMGTSSNWLQSREGDIADAGTTRNRHYYFNHSHVDNEIGWERRDIYCDADTDIYLMFAVPSAESQVNPNNMHNPECLYGWVRLEVGANGEVGLLGSAIGLEGQGMIVGGGAIPEPSSVLLLLLGCAVIVLRRNAKRTEHFASIGVPEKAASKRRRERR